MSKASKNRKTPEAQKKNAASCTRPAQGRWIKAITQGGNIRAVAIEATGLAQEICSRHKTSQAGSQALAEALVAALTVASYCKQGENVNLQIKGTKRISNAMIDASWDGKVRGYVVETDGIDDPDSAIGIWGDQGLISVLRTKPGDKELPFTGTVPLVTGHLAKDMTYYWHQSEQVPSAVGICSQADPQGNITVAGGFLVQVLGGANEEEVKALEDNVNHIHDMAQQLSGDPNPMGLLSQIFPDSEFTILEERELCFECHCSRERVINSLALLEKSEIEEIKEKGEDLEVRCDFCAESYTIEPSEI